MGIKFFEENGEKYFIVEEDREEDLEFKEITENPIILDFSKCKYWQQVHDMLKEKFGLPEYYGENWDALWDCLRDLFEDMGDWEVHIKGFHTMPQDWQQSCKTMLSVFDDVHKRTPNVVFKLID